MKDIKKNKTDFSHIPVMPEESLHFLNIKKGGIYVDGTLGGGGHSELIAKVLDGQGKLIGIDQDIDAIEASKKRLFEFGDLIKYVNDNFSNLELILDNLKIEKVDGIILDLGVSSYQLANYERGFSFSQSEENINSELDMRMDRSQELTAYDVVNKYSQEQLRAVLRDLGEEMYAGKIARRIVQVREVEPITTINDLLEIIRYSTPPKYRFRKGGGHYANKVFRGIRMEVNRELDVIQKVIPQAVARLKPGGRLVIISFHSLEDRIVKRAFREMALTKDDRGPIIKILTKRPLVPAEEEKENNPKSNSAKLRAVEKIA